MVGFSKKYIDIEQSYRESGQSSYTFTKRLVLAFNYFLSHSTKPIKIMIGFGLCVSAASIIAGLALIYRYYKYGVSIEGWTSIAVLLFFQTGLITSFLGVIGLYIGKIFLQSKNRPQHIIQETINFEK
jgi:dolichol-phosphate mannosyltransferase